MTETTEIGKLLDAELKRQEELTASFAKVHQDNLILKADSDHQAKVIRYLQEDVAVLKNTVKKLFAVMKEKGLVEGTYVFGAWIK